MIIRVANKLDYPQIIDIYNQAIPTRRITADLEPVTQESRLGWFEFHLNSDKYPIWVLDNIIQLNQEPQILGWCTFSPFYPRAAFDNTVEISIYLDNNAKGHGYGSHILQFMKEQMLSRDINTLMAYVIEENIISRKTFEKQGFKQWGRYPNIANMGDSYQTFLMYGYQTGIENNLTEKLRY
ncbi:MULTISPECIES: GNAT family N-acetyltransferase [Pasteurellaceae]|uniref:Acetyltransferase, GNAT family n=1 Tax=Pasteurella bettyae CCUG 2042 TaxID=1095749 RepID=I3DBN2_9PAST|nr:MULTISPECIES: GNAT family N-acetyltransferase [Pasteurellaceae]EIJ69125.1 acetyltransferase, GNAT family [Pasteurella bettyae CCUG 2042]SUB22832.1 Putative phosphinothricin acetyltransferase YwnH [Pasteurella bettyae]